MNNFINNSPNIFKEEYADVFEKFTERKAKLPTQTNQTAYPEAEEIRVAKEMLFK